MEEAMEAKELGGKWILSTLGRTDVLLMFCVHPQEHNRQHLRQWPLENDFIVYKVLSPTSPSILTTLQLKQIPILCHVKKRSCP